MNSVKAFLRALAFGSVLALVMAVLLKVLDAPERWYLAAALVALFATTLFDREGFYGEPHPFARRHRLPATISSGAALTRAEPIPHDRIVARWSVAGAGAFALLSLAAEVL